MTLTPNDIRSIEFSSQMRGYDREEVDNFLEKVAQEVDEVKQENVKMQMALDTLRLQLSRLVQNEDIIKVAAIDARRNADLTIQNAKKEAQAILDKAKEEIEQFAELKKKKIQEVEAHIQKMEQFRKAYLTKLRTLVSSHLELIEKESVLEVREALSQPGDIKITESKDITSAKTETIAGPIEDEEDKADIPLELRTTVHGEFPDEPDKVEEGDVALTDALRKQNQVKEALPPYIKDKDEDNPEPIPSLASPKKKWAETTARAEEVPAGFITKNQNESGQIPQPISQPKNMEPNPVLIEEIEAMQTTIVSKAHRSGKVDVAKEFDEIAAKFNEEMDKAEKKK